MSFLADVQKFAIGKQSKTLSTAGRLRCLTSWKHMLNRVACRVFLHLRGSENLSLEHLRSARVAECLEWFLVPTKRVGMCPGRWLGSGFGARVI